MPSPGSSRTRRGCKVKSPFSLLSPPPPQLAQGGQNGTGLRGLFGAVEWKIDFNPLCSCEGARSALPDQGSRHSGEPLPRPGLESPQSCTVCRPQCPSDLVRPSLDVSPRAVLRTPASRTHPGSDKKAEFSSISSPPYMNKCWVRTPKTRALLGHSTLEGWNGKFTEYRF
ncbi:hypothetical protein STEG23_032028 [Scotinomys teguina]